VDNPTKLKAMASVLLTIRNLVQLGALFLFIYQSVMALRKYIETPTIVVRSEVPYNDLYKSRYGKIS
jgi:hypothetical protein